MTSYAGLDVSQQETQVCVIDAGGAISWIGKTRSEPTRWRGCCASGRLGWSGRYWRAARSPAGCAAA
jgi:hypothetical protein